MTNTFVINEMNYQYRRGASPVLEDVSLKIQRGQATAILGLSGSGKSTLLNILGRLIEHAPAPRAICFYPQDGREIDYAGLTSSESNALRLRHFGFIMQAANMLPNQTCRLNVMMPLILQGNSVQQSNQQLEILLHSLNQHSEIEATRDLVDALARGANEVSGGQRQRMAVLRALIHDPEVVFADEPCNSLDPRNALRFRELLQGWLRQPTEQNKSRTLVLVTHNPREAWNVASQFVFMNGRGLGELQSISRNAFHCAEDLEEHLLGLGKPSVL